MTMQGSDFYSGTALSGAGTGAATGAMLGSQVAPGYGTAIGGLIGGGLGLFTGAAANSQRSNATKQQLSSLDQLMANIRAMSTADYDRHIGQLDKTLSFYGPAQQYWDRLYGQPGAAPQTGQGSWANTGVK